jgi:hypothetical protein
MPDRALPLGTEEARAHRWWRRGRPIGSIGRASKFLDDVGFALLFPKSGLALPSLFEAASDRAIERLGSDWGPDTERVWGWKDELPKRQLAWYGRFLHSRPSFLSPAFLKLVYPRAGDPEDFDRSPLGPDARRIARMILLSGPLSTAALREATAAEGGRGAARFSKTLGELGRELVVTHFGTEDQGAGWPSAVLELTARAFDVRRSEDASADEARLEATRRFLDTMLWARPYHLGNAFGWGAPVARAAFEDLVDRGEAARDGPGYRRTE